MVHVTSTALDDVAYDPDARTLAIRFCSGELYTYLDVPPEVVRALLAAPSLGRYFQAHIRGRYAFRH